VKVLWGNPGIGTVKVTETSADGCPGVSAPLTVTVDECTGLTDQQAAAPGIFPNPASDYVTVQNCRDSQISLYSMDGKMLMRTESQNECYSFDVRLFPKGIYMLNIRRGSFNTIMKLVIQ
jgi:hypothetical protein